MATTVYRPATISTGDSSLVGNASVSGNLTVDTNTLYADATTNEVGIRTVTPDGTLHVHTASAGTVTAHGDCDDFVIENSAIGGMSILTPDANHGGIYIGSPSDSIGTFINWNYNNGILQIGTSKTGADVVFFSGAEVEILRLKSTADIVVTGDVGVGGTPNANAILDLQSATKAFMPPRMTTAEKNAIASPTSGMVVYDSTLGKLAVRGVAAWETVTSV